MQRMIDDEFLSMLESKDLQIHFPMSGLLGGTRRSNAYGSSVEFADYRNTRLGTICAGSIGIFTPALKSCICV